MAIQVYIGTLLFLAVALPLVYSSYVVGAPTVCGLPADSGPCLAFFPRWYFNTTNNACQKFVYGGCLGNANNFPDFTSCFLNCGGIVRCWLPKDTGPCFANFRRYFFNVFTQSCEEFVYGGCLGNANRFRSPEQCQFQCGDFRSPFSNRGRRVGYVDRNHP